MQLKEVAEDKTHKESVDAEGYKLQEQFFCHRLDLSVPILLML